MDAREVDTQRTLSKSHLLFHGEGRARDNHETGVNGRPLMDTFELRSKIQQLQTEDPVVRLNRRFATHLQHELDRHLINGMSEMMAAFEDEWCCRLSEEGKTNLIMGMDVRVEVNEVPAGLPFCMID